MRYRCLATVRGVCPIFHSGDDLAPRKKRRRRRENGTVPFGLRLTLSAILVSSVIAAGKWAVAGGGPLSQGIHWRFEKGSQGERLRAAVDESGKCPAIAEGEAPVLSRKFPRRSSR